MTNCLFEGATTDHAARLCTARPHLVSRQLEFILQPLLAVIRQIFAFSVNQSVSMRDTSS